MLRFHCSVEMFQRAFPKISGKRFRKPQHCKLQPIPICHPHANRVQKDNLRTLKEYIFEENKTIISGFPCLQHMIRPSEEYQVVILWRNTHPTLACNSGV